MPPSAPAFVQISKTIQSTNATNPTTITLPSLTLTTGNLAVLAFSMGGRGFGTTTINSVTDAQGNTYSNNVGATAMSINLPSAIGNYGEQFWMYWVNAIKGGAGQLSINMAAGYPTVTWFAFWLEYSPASSPPVSYINQNGVTSGTISNSTVLNSGTSALNTIVSLAFNCSGTNTTPSTITDRSANSYTGYGVVGDQASSAPSGEAVTFSYTSGSFNQWALLSINFPAGTAPPPTTGGGNLNPGCDFKIRL